ncbi:hypothetical protein [uncultured Maricaulis sp.]|uniref:hypothetical protein n=1 Tax=uncultured Maricaulis sp. TaxID=174710 RepID=UPI0026045A5A|nr:hypothetical protein [uncultured Maricaulis sp.]
MAKKGQISRRSFLTRIGGIGLTSGAAALVSGCVTQGPGYTGFTDTDYGRYADRAGYGRGVRRAPTPASSNRRITDADTGDRVGQGQGGRRGSCTDSDTRANSNRADPTGGGRRC